MTMRGAYVEWNYGHGEIQPTFWWLARQCRVELDFHVLSANAALDPLGLVRGPVRLVPIPVADLHDPFAEPLGPLEFFEHGRYDFVILGTAEPADRVTALRDIDVPQLHVVHNLHHRAAPAERVTPCVLAPHALRAVDGSVILIEPFHLGELSDPQVATGPGGPTVVSVPGNVELRRRNYGSLVRALVQLRDAGVTPDDLVVRLVGRAFGLEPHLQGHVRYSGRYLWDVLRSAGVERFVEMTPRELTYPELYHAIAASPYSLPLIDDCFVHTSPYMNGKHSGSIGVGVGAGSMPILNERHARALGIDFGPRYRLDDVATGLRAALRCQPLEAERAALATFREERLAASAAAFAGWLERCA